MRDHDLYRLDIPTATGLTATVTIDLTAPTAVVTTSNTVTDEPGPLTKAVTNITDHLMWSWFMEPMPNQMLTATRSYRVSPGWTADGWVEAFGHIVRETWIPCEESSNV